MKRVDVGAVGAVDDANRVHVEHVPVGDCHVASGREEWEGEGEEGEEGEAEEREARGEEARGEEARGGGEAGRSLLRSVPHVSSCDSSG